MPDTAAEAVWRGTKPALEPWRPDHFVYKFSMHDIAHMERTNSEREYTCVHTHEYEHFMAESHAYVAR